ncbi:MAG: DUF86 domain-containing protein [Candidatus Uhrbacteria bacterium]|nr:DUF86 domain-containing protein [Candidatus Uhrbacteria bacterium]
MKRKCDDDLRMFFSHILENIEEIEKFSKNISKSAFKKDTKTHYAVLRALEIIGEAVKNIPDSYRDKYPAIPWKGMAGMRDVLIHDYFGVDLDEVWGVVKKDIPKLKKEMAKLPVG